MTPQSLSENPAVIAPMKALTARQRAALKAIARYRSRRVPNGWRLGGERTRFSNALIAVLERHGLVVERTTPMSGTRLCLTYAGHIAIGRLEERSGK